MGHFLVSETFLQTLAQIQEHFTVAARIRQAAGRETVQLFHQTLFSLAARHISSKVRACLSKVDVTGNFPYNSYIYIQFSQDDNLRKVDKLTGSFLELARKMSGQQ